MLTQNELGQLLWAAQGITDEHGHRSAPSAGALYPIELYVVGSRVDDLDAGLYHCVAGEHALEMIRLGDLASELSDIAVGQGSVADGAVALVIVGVVGRTADKYGEHAERFVVIAAGAVAQNALLQAEAIGLGGVPIGSFDISDLQAFVGTDAMPILVVPIGRPGER